MDEVAWYWDNAGKETHPVGGKKGNAYGLYDMSGNVFEWVWDPWDEQAYKRGEASDPIVDASSPDRVNRGGSWGNSARLTRVSRRDWNGASLRFIGHGFRFLRTVP